jgi:hypothetical protein
MSGNFENRSRVGGVGSDIVRRDLDTSGQDALINTIKNIVACLIISVFQAH